MKTKVFITIDTEEDTWSEYSLHNNPVDNVYRIPLLQELFNRYGAVPTYLVNYPVASDQRAAAILSKYRESGVCEIGAHCHPWNTPPYVEPINKKNSMICNLPHELQYEKLRVLTETIQSNFGAKPFCFRAGRWGFGAETANAICRLGFQLDTSVSPLFDWSAQQGPDFRSAGLGTYRFEPESILVSNKQGRLLEVPPTIGFLQKNYRFCRFIREIFSNPLGRRLHTLGALDRMRIVNRRWLSPEQSPGSEMVRLSKTFVAAGFSFLNMSFHSTSLLPGKSPFVQTQADLDDFLGRIETFLKHIVKQGFEFLPLSAALDV